MGLKVKKFQEIMNDMVDWVATTTSKLTDFSEGSAIRTLFEAVASSIEEVYFSMYKTAMWAIENSIFQSFGFSQIPAQPANGYLTLTFGYPLESDLYLPTGTQFATVTQTNGRTLYFQTQQDYTITAGSVEADIEVFCTELGIIGNVSVDAIKIMVNPIRGVSEVTNKSAFLTGQEAEALSSRKQRFNKFIETLSRGTIKAIEYGAQEVAGVAGVWVEEDTGLIKVYAHDLNGDLPDSLKQSITDNLVNYRSAGIPVEVLSITKQEISVNVTVTVLSSYNTTTFHDSLVTSIVNFMNSFPVAKSFYISDLIRHVMDYDSVAIIDCKVVSPTADVVVPQEEIIRPSEVIVTLAS